MSKTNLYRNGADTNPVQHKKLPKEPLDFEFPITTESPQPIRLWRYLGHLFVVSGVTVLLPLTLAHDAFIFGLFMAYVVINLLLRTYHKIGPKIAKSALSAFVITHFSFLMAYEWGYSYLTWTVGSITVLYTLHVAKLFRTHWVSRASCGMLPDKTIEAFRKHRLLPDGLKPKPTLPAFIAALRSWANYDPHNAVAAGLMKCPSGEAQDRYAASISLAILWSGVLVSPQSIQFLSQFGNPLLILPVLLLIVPVGLPYLLMALFSIDILGKSHALIEHQFAAKNWTPFVRKLQTSKNALEKESVYLGRVHGDGSPILYPAKNLMRGVWIQGSAHSGRTLTVMQLQEQLIGMGCSVVDIDLAADSHELLWSAHAAAQRVQKAQGGYVPVYPFTTVHGQASCLLDIFSQGFWSDRSPEEKAEIMLGIFGLSSRTSTLGESWYRDAAWTVEQHLTSKYPDIKSFHEASCRLSEELQHAKPWELSKRVQEHGEHPRLILARLGMVDAVNFRGTYPQEVLDCSLKLDRLFQTPSVLHCSLPVTMDPVGNPEVARVILSSILNAAAHSSSRPVKCYVIINQFERMAARQLDTILLQCKAQGVGVILTNQSPSDLHAVDTSMADTILGRTAMQAWIGATDSLGVQQVQDLGGQYIEHLVSKSVSHNHQGTSSTITTSEHVLDRVSSGLIDRVNSSEDQFFLRLTDDGGYAAYGGQIFVGQMGYHTATQAEYEQRVNNPWPQASRGMLINGQHRPTAGPPNSSLLGATSRPATPNRRRRPTPLHPS